MKKRFCHIITDHGEVEGKMYLNINLSQTKNWVKVERFQIIFDDSDLECLMSHVRKILADRRRQLDHIAEVVK